jgi:putative ABC transport system permease protein
LALLWRVGGQIDAMFKHFVGMTFRALQKNKVFSFLNIFGLAIGLACAGLIFLWVEDELSWDSNHVNKDRIYVVRVNVTQDAGTWTHSSTPGPLAPSLASLPGVAATCRTSEGETPVFRIGDRVVQATGMYAEPSLFGIFTLPFVQGTPRRAFSQLYSLVITESAAKKLFGGGQEVLGKKVRMDDKQDYVVTGVVKDMPQNSSLQFEWLAPFQVYFQNDHWQKWNNFGLTTYVELKPGVDAAVLNGRWLAPKYDFTTQKVEADVSSVHIFLFGMKQWRLYEQFDNGKVTGGGRIQYVRLFSMIAWIVLFIACINFMNLATARSEKRSREVGVRKVLGAGKGSLVGQFLGEALFMTLLAAIGAVIIIVSVLPAFNLLVGKDLSPGLDNPVHLGALLMLTLVCGVVAGSYPSLYLSSFQPILVLKGMKVLVVRNLRFSSVFRKGLVVLQFTMSIVLIIGTMIVYQQIQHVKNRDLGFNKDNLVEVPLRANMNRDYASIRQDLIHTGAVENAALADHVTLNSGNNTGGISWAGKSPDSRVTVSQRLVSPEYLATLGMHIQEGRDFGPADTANPQRFFQGQGAAPVLHVVISASMERLMGKGSAVGKQLQFSSNAGPVTMTVVGVIRDYVYGNMYGQAAPVIFYCLKDFTSLMYLRLNPLAPTQQAMAQIEGVLRKDNPGYPFEFSFVDEQFNNKFLSEMLISKLSRVFASLAILISCLGLFGLAAYMAERRIKEVGIRKVLGASPIRITQLLSKDFLRLVLISCLIAFPVAGWIMHSWLLGYAYRIGIRWWVFVVAGVTAMVIALITVGTQALRAAMTNPTRSLRNE